MEERGEGAGEKAEKDMKKEGKICRFKLVDKRGSLTYNLFCFYMARADFVMLFLFVCEARFW